MDSVGLRELRQNASDLVRRVEQGEEITITVAGRPGARLVPAAPRAWRQWSDIAELFNGPADPDWAEDRDEIRHDGLAAQHDRQRTRPERSEECETRIGLGDFGERGLLEDVDDERVEERTALDREDLGERGGISRVGGEAVDRLGRQGHAGALTQELGRPRKVGGS